MPKCAFLLAIEYLKMTQMWPCPQGRLGLVKSRWAGNLPCAGQERRANKHLVIQEEQDSTLTETSLNSFHCKGLNPNSTWLKPKRDSIDSSKQVELQIMAENQV